MLAIFKPSVEFNFSDRMISHQANPQAIMDISGQRSGSKKVIFVIHMITLCGRSGCAFVQSIGSLYIIKMDNCVYQLVALGVFLTLILRIDNYAETNTMITILP